MHVQTKPIGDFSTLEHWSRWTYVKNMETCHSNSSRNYHTVQEAKSNEVTRNIEKQWSYRSQKPGSIESQDVSHRLYETPEPAQSY